MVIPPRVRDGDRVAVCAPAAPVTAAQMSRGLELLGQRFRVEAAPELFVASGFLAGDDAHRADQFNRALRDPDVRAIIMARGGYGVMRMLSLLDADALRRDPKPIVGFSDGVALLSWAERAGVLGIHGPVARDLAKLPASDVAWLHRLLTDPEPPGEMPWSLSRLGAGGGGRRDGRLVGGNLTLLSVLVATPWQVRSDGAVLLLEDIDEAPYAIDRYLTHLLCSGALAGARAALVGDFTRCGDRTPGTTVDDPSPALAVISERLTALDLPALAGAPLGHGSRNTAVPWGARCVVDLDAGTMTLLDGAVA